MLTNVTKNSILDLAGILDTILYYITRNLAIHVYFLLFFFLDDSLFSSSSIFVTSHPGKRSTPRNEPLSSVKFSQFSAKRGNKNGSVYSSSDARDLRFSITFCKLSSILETKQGVSKVVDLLPAFVSLVTTPRQNIYSTTLIDQKILTRNMKHKGMYSQYHH